MSSPFPEPSPPPRFPFCCKEPYLNCIPCRALNVERHFPFVSHRWLKPGALNVISGHLSFFSLGDFSFVRGRSCLRLFFIISGKSLVREVQIRSVQISFPPFCETTLFPSFLFPFFFLPGRVFPRKPPPKREMFCYSLSGAFLFLSNQFPPSYVEKNLFILFFDCPPPPLG